MNKPVEQDSVLVELKGGKGIITINRPKVLNAVDWNTLSLLQDAFNNLIENQDVRVIILTGAGEKAFISGGDINTEIKLDGLAAYHWSHAGHRLCALIENSPKPVIAAINGYALGGGFEISLACDFRICSPNAKFGAPETKLGVICGLGGNVRLPRIVGKTKALEILMTGQMFDAQEAYRLNLVNRIAPAGQLMEAVDELCANLLDKNTIVLDLIKKAVDYGMEIDLRSADQYEASLFGLVFSTEDKNEGMTAFLEKRPPRFKNR
ncbi:MAG: enoyl-CoA hydratase-related protein [Clostridia bacterium]|jgi:enoyl-CoA hydratase|nr:enoyl-CoA hydratase-related protein [Clostridia bacterium]